MDAVENNQPHLSFFPFSMLRYYEQMEPNQTRTERVSFVIQLLDQLLSMDTAPDRQRIEEMFGRQLNLSSDYSTPAGGFGSHSSSDHDNFIPEVYFSMSHPGETPGAHLARLKFEIQPLDCPVSSDVIRNRFDSGHYQAKFLDLREWVQASITFGAPRAGRSIYVALTETEIEYIATVIVDWFAHP